MGNTIPSNLNDTVVNGGPLQFHETHASNVELSHAGRRAKRLTGQRGLCFSQRPILPGERVCLKVTGLSHGHNNKGIGLCYGYTAVDPASDDTTLHSGRQELVATEHGYWLKTVSEHVVKRGSVLVFYLCIGGEVYYGRNDEEYGILFAGVRTDLPLWVVVDLSGSATSLEFVDVGHFSKTAASDMTKAARAKFESRRTSQLSRSTEALPTSAAEASSSDFASRRRRSSLPQRLFHSARHSARGQQPDVAAQTQDTAGAGGDGRRRSKRRARSHHSVLQRDVPADDHSASSDTASSATAESLQSTATAGTGTASTGTGTHGGTGSSTSHRPAQQSSRAATVSESDNTRRQSATRRLTHTSSLDEPLQREAHSARDIVTHDGRPTGDEPVIRRYRWSDVTIQMPFSSTTGRNVHISADGRTASRQLGDFCNGYVFTQQPLMPGEELVVRITGTNVEYRGGLTVGLTSCDPTKLKVTDLPDDADKLLDRPEYWVVHKNICSHPKVNDELAFLRTLSGEFKYCRNGRRAGTLMHVDCSLPLWAFFDIYGSTNKLESLGIVTAAGSEADRNASHLSRFIQHADVEPATTASAVSSTTLHRRSTSASVIIQQRLAAAVSQSVGNTTAAVTSSANVVSSSRCLPATVSPSSPASTPVADVSALLFDDIQLLPELPPPLIPVPDRYQPLVYVDTNRTPPVQQHPDRTVREAAPCSPRRPGGECSVCMESEPNAALYPCGHMCLCYDCAVGVQKLHGALCPICRQPIIDILRIYRT